MIEKSVQLILGENIFEFFIYFGIIGLDVVDVGKLIGQGVFMYDLGFVFIVVCEFKIIYIDGGKGVFLYRGYFIDQLVDDFDYLEVCYFLLYGEFFNVVEKEKFESIIWNYIMVYEQFCNFY